MIAMTGPRLIRGLRIAWSGWWGIMCGLLIGLWVRSYSYMDQLGGRLTATRILLVGSMRGGLIVQGLPHDWEYSWNIRSAYQVGPRVTLPQFRFGSEIRIVPHGFQLPHWLLVASSMFLG